MSGINKHISLVLLLVLCFITFNTEAQLVVNNPANVTTNDLINNFIGTGVTISNVKYTGSPKARSLFNGVKSNIGLDEGIILATGYATNAVGPNDDYGFKKSGLLDMPGDKDLEVSIGCMLPQCLSFDASVLEFDFIPQYSQITFNYVFASEEYPNGVCFKYLDAFALFLTGDSSSGGKFNKTNIAFIPDTNLNVEINTINSGKPGRDSLNHQYFTDCISLLYSKFFINNGKGDTPEIDSTVQYNGFTAPLTATANVIPCHQYHLKIVISDVMDGYFDSGIFLEKNSFTSPGIAISKSITQLATDTAAIEGCSEVQVCFDIGKAAKKERTIHLYYSGDASTRADMKKLPDSLILKAGDTLACFKIIPENDFISKGLQTLTVKTSSCSADSINVYIKDKPELKLTAKPSKAIICLGESTELSVNASGGISAFPYKYKWSDEASSNDTIITVSPKINKTYTATVKDTCGSIATIKIPVIVNQLPPITINGDTNICEGASSILKVVENGYKYFWAPVKYTTQSIHIRPDTTTKYYIKVTDNNNCIDSTSIKVRVNLNPIADFITLPDTIVSELSPYISLQAIPDCNECTYNWSIIELNKSFTGSEVNDFKLPEKGTYTVILTVTDNNNCNSIKTTKISVSKTLRLLTSVRLYPNPNDGSFNLDVTLPLDGNVSIESFNILGRKVLSETHLMKTGLNKLEMKLSNFGAGVYFIRIKTDNEVFNKKIIIK